jgi:hypothetical protein
MADDFGFDPWVSSDANIGGAGAGPATPPFNPGTSSDANVSGSTPTGGGGPSGAGVDWGKLLSGIGSAASKGVGQASSAVGALGPFALIASAYNKMGKPIPGQDKLEAIGQPALDAGTAKLTAASKGELTQPQQASLDQFRTQQREQWEQYFANAKISDSSTRQAVFQKIDEQALVMSNQFINETFQQGITALGLAQGPFAAIAQAQVQRDTALQEAIANAMNAWATMNASGGRVGGGGGSADPSWTSIWQDLSGAFGTGSGGGDSGSGAGDGGGGGGAIGDGTAMSANFGGPTSPIPSGVGNLAGMLGFGPFGSMAANAGINAANAGIAANNSVNLGMMSTGDTNVSGGFAGAGDGGMGTGVDGGFDGGFGAADGGF